MLWYFLQAQAKNHATFIASNLHLIWIKRAAVVVGSRRCLYLYLTYCSFIPVKTLRSACVCERTCLYDHYVVSFSSSHIHAGHALSTKCVAARDKRIKKDTPLPWMCAGVLSHFLDLFERANLRSLPLGAFSIFHDCAMYLFTLEYAVN